ncbi:Pycsar system effector family protein [Streptomyces sp. NPDC090106]|uniref:Pycsar system effector family protein n=1 Tax=Streptomyces sp. NPDC090106 TaxID=3365946 RepID=UPI003828C4E7
MPHRPALFTDLTDANLDAACTTVAAEIARTDGKASLLLAFDGALLAGLATAADQPLPTASKILGGAAVLALAVAAVLLLLVVRPRLGGSGSDRASFPYWARLDDDTIRASMTGDTRPARIRVLSRIAMKKFSRLRAAVDTILAALALLTLAAAGLAL